MFRIWNVYFNESICCSSYLTTWKYTSILNLTCCSVDNIVKAFLTLPLQKWAFSIVAVKFSFEMYLIKCVDYLGPAVSVTLMNEQWIKYLKKKNNQSTSIVFLLCEFSVCCNHNVNLFRTSPFLNAAYFIKFGKMFLN